MDQRTFILNTLLPYKLDPEKAPTKDGGGSYFEKGRPDKFSACGQHMTKMLYSGKDIVALIEKYGMDQLFTPAAIEVDLSVKVWMYMQMYHDAIAERSFSNKEIEGIEKELGINLDELKFQI